MRRVYLDNHATTPMDPRVLKAMLPYFVHRFGNAASFTHSFGREALETVEKSRAEIARLIHCLPKEIIFTGGATESNNLAIKGAAAAGKKRGNHIITVSTEHKSVLDPCRRLEMNGFRVTYLPVGKDGRLDLRALEKAVRKETILISVMMANNEIGVLQPVSAIGRLAKAKGILFHCDAAQAVGKVPVDVKALNVDFLSFTAHKIYGPKGVGALYVRKTNPAARLLPQLEGGGHETGLRSGTLNVPGIVGFAKACEVCRLHLKREAIRLKALRDRLEKTLLKNLPGTVIHGNRLHRLPNNLNIGFEGVPAKHLIEALPHLAVSAGSACLSTSPEPSYVLKAIGVSDSLRRSSIRLGLGRFTKKEEIDVTIKEVTRAVRELRARF